MDGAPQKDSSSASAALCPLQQHFTQLLQLAGQLLDLLPKLALHLPPKLLPLLLLQLRAFQQPLPDQFSQLSGTPCKFAGGLTDRSPD